MRVVAAAADILHQGPHGLLLLPRHTGLVEKVRQKGERRVPVIGRDHLSWGFLAPRFAKARGLILCVVDGLDTAAMMKNVRAFRVTPSVEGYCERNRR